MQRLVGRHADGLGSSAAAIIAIASNDAGFAPALAYAASKGCTAVAITEPLKTRRRPAWAPPPDLSRYPLPAAAGRCLLWDSAWLPSLKHAAEEAAVATEWAQQAGLPLAPLQCPGGVVAAWRSGQRGVERF